MSRTSSTKSLRIHRNLGAKKDSWYLVSGRILAADRSVRGNGDVFAEVCDEIELIDGGLVNAAHSIEPAPTS